jgi:hypothetical protein
MRKNAAKVPRDERESDRAETALNAEEVRALYETQVLRSRAIRDRERRARERLGAALKSAVGQIKPATRRRVFDAKVRLAWGARYW